jgi:hypothetical protein
MAQHAMTATGPLSPEGLPLYGLVAEFETPEQLIEAARQAHNAGYRKMDAFTPFPVEGLGEALGHRDIWVPLMMLVAGLGGAALGFIFLVFCVTWDYPLNVGGKPPLSWPMFIPITFEIGVLLASLTGVAGMIVINGLPRPHHPLFDAPNFDRASADRFFLCIESSDRIFDLQATRLFLERLSPASVAEAEVKDRL